MAKKTNNLKYYSRVFLNKKSGLAAIECDVDTWDFGVGFDGSIKISDCNRSISLDISTYDDESLVATYKKLQILHSEICKIFYFYTENYDNIANLLKKQQEERKERLKNRKTKPASQLIEESDNANV